MADVPASHRLDGARIDTGANQPFPLDDPDCVHLVENGYLDVFAVEWRENRAVGRRRFVARVRAGEMAFGAQPVESPDEQPHALVFLAVPSRGAVLVRGKRSRVGQGFDLAATHWIDQWIVALSDYLARELPPPRDTVALEAEPNVSYAAGSVLTAQHRDVVGRADLVVVLGRTDLVVAPGEALWPVTERTWCAIDEDALVSAVFTPTAHVTDRLWPAFDRFNTRILEFARLTEAEAVDALQRRRRDAWMSERSTVTSALQCLSRVLGPGSPGPAVDGSGRTSLHEAARVVAEACGARLEIPTGRESDAAGAAETLRELAARSGLQTRRIRLAGNWWRRAGLPLIGFRAGTRGGEPLALLSDDRGAYRARDPATGVAFPVDRTTATDIAPDAMMLYAPLPGRVESRTDVVRFALHKRGRDFCVMVGMGVMAGLAALVTPILTGQILVEIIPRAETSLWLAPSARS